MTEPLDSPGVAGALKTTLIVQVAPTASVPVVVQDPPAVPVGREKGLLVLVRFAVIPVVVATFPVLVTVRVCALLAVPSYQVPNESGLGDTVSVRTTGTAVPVSVTGEPFTVTLAAIVAAAVLVPPVAGVAGALNTMLMVQLLLAANVAPHVPAPPCAVVALENGAWTVTTIAVKGVPVSL